MESIPERQESGPSNLYGDVILTLNSSAHVDTLYLSRPKQREYHARVWGLLKSRYDDAPMSDLFKENHLDFAEMSSVQMHFAVFSRGYQTSRSPGRPARLCP